MRCPFCNEEMKKGVITGDGRAKVRFCPDDDKSWALDKVLTDKGCIDATYTLTKFSIDSFYCENCKKMIFDTDVQN